MLDVVKYSLNIVGLCSVMQLLFGNNLILSVLVFKLCQEGMFRTVFNLELIWLHYEAIPSNDLQCFMHWEAFPLIVMYMNYSSHFINSQNYSHYFFPVILFPSSVISLHICGDQYNATKDTRGSLCKILKYCLSVSLSLSLSAYMLLVDLNHINVLILVIV